jgi:hypothetical protein
VNLQLKDHRAIATGSSWPATSRRQPAHRRRQRGRRVTSAALRKPARRSAPHAELPGSPSIPAVLPTIFLAVEAFLAVISVTGSALIARSRRRSSSRARHAPALP